MDWVTIIWSINAGICLTLAGINLLVWCKERNSWMNLAFAVLAASTATCVVFELKLMHAQTAIQCGYIIRWAHVSVAIMVISLLWFIRLHLQAGSFWLLLANIALRIIVLVINFSAEPNINFSEMTSVAHLPMWGERVVVPMGVKSQWEILIRLSEVLILLFILNAGIGAWRQGRRRQAIVMSIALFITIGGAATFSVMMTKGGLPVPMNISMAFLILILFMGYELSNELVYARHISRQLKQSQQRMSLAASAADLGLWEWNVQSNEIWASEKGRARIGAEESERLLFDRFLEFVHHDDREPTRQALYHALESEDEFKIEYRMSTVNKGIRWMATQGHVERDGRGKPLWVRGISMDITERKKAEEEIQQSKRRLQYFARKLIAAHEEERALLARELHDDFTQRLAVLSFDLAKMEVGLKAAGHTIPNDLKKIKEQIIKLSEDIRDTSHQLHPSIIDDLGLERAIQSKCSNFTRQTGIAIDFKPTCIPSTVSRDISVNLFRVIQESLRNIQKHAHVNKAEICLAGEDGHIILTVQDSGAGFDLDGSKRTHGLGLFSMQERVELMNGIFSVESAPGRGTTINVTVPYQGPESGQSQDTIGR